MTPSEPVRVSSLLGRAVADVHGRTVGAVIDVRLVQDGPAHPGGLARLRVDGLVVSPRHSGRLLGYERTPKEGPWLIRVLVEAYNKGTVYVPWRSVARLGADSVQLEVEAGELSAPAAVPVDVPKRSGG